MVEQRVVARRSLAAVGAAAWILFAVAWQISDYLGRSRPFEGSPRNWFLVGVAAGTIGGLVLLGESVRFPAPRSKRFVAGMVAISLAIGLQVIAGWALPVWALVYGVAAALLIPNLRPAGLLIAGGFVGSVGVWFALESMGVGPIDEYGDHPYAWNIAMWSLALAVAAGLIVRYRDARESEIVDAPVSV